MELAIWHIAVIFVVVCILVFLAFRLGIQYRKRVGEAQIGAAETKAREIIDDALKAADAKKREILLEAKEEALKTKNDMEAEVRERRGEVQRQEKRILQKEEALDRKNDSLEKKEGQIAKKAEELEKKNQEISHIHEKKLAELEKISGLTSDQAKAVLLQTVEEDVKHEMPLLLKRMSKKPRKKLPSVPVRSSLTLFSVVPLITWLNPPSLWFPFPMMR